MLCVPTGTTICVRCELELNIALSRRRGRLAGDAAVGREGIAVGGPGQRGGRRRRGHDARPAPRRCADASRPKAARVVPAHPAASAGRDGRRGGRRPAAGRYDAQPRFCSAVTVFDLISGQSA